MSVPAPSADLQRRFAFIHEVPNFEPATVQGNVSDDLKRLVAKIYAYFAGKDQKWAFAPSVADQSRYMAIGVYGVEDGKAVGRAWAESVHEVVVTKGEHSSAAFVRGRGLNRVYAEMCNSFGIMHGACAALFLEAFVFNASFIHIRTLYF